MAQIINCQFCRPDCEASERSTAARWWQEKEALMHYSKGRTQASKPFLLLSWFHGITLLYRMV